MSSSETPLPKMSATIDAIIEEKENLIARAEENRTKDVRTTEYTATNFKRTNCDRLWCLKQENKFIDAILVCDDGHTESVHLDMLFELKCEPNFFHLAENKPTDSGGGGSCGGGCHQKVYIVDAKISSIMTKELVHFAYHQKYSLTEKNLFDVLSVGIAYRIKSLVAQCVQYFVEHCDAKNVFRAFEITFQGNIFANQEANEIFQKYIEDNFEQIMKTNCNDLLSWEHYMLVKVLQLDRLNVSSEQVVWKAIKAWIEHDLEHRTDFLQRLLLETLRFGRIHSDYIHQEIYQSDLFQRVPTNVQNFITKTINNALNCDDATVFRDGHGLLYSREIKHFRPRSTRNVILAAGGWVDGKTTQSIEVYDYQANLWFNTVVKLPAQLSYFGLEVVGSTIYVFGGSNGKSIFRHLMACDLAKRKIDWDAKASMIETRCYVSSASLNGYIYAIGGFNQERRIRKCERYDTSLNTWTEIADLNLARSDAATVTHNGRIYIAGGINDTQVERTVEVYYPEQNMWLLIKSMTTPRTSFPIVSFRGRIWALGGNGGSRRVKSCESYDPETDSWRMEPAMSNDRSTFKAIVLNEELYAIGGYNGHSPIRTVEKFSPSQNAWVKVHRLRHDRSGMSLAVLPNYRSLQ